MADSEGHYAGVAVVGWPGDHGKSRNHVAVDDIAVLTTRRIGTLTGENRDQQDRPPAGEQGPIVDQAELALQLDS